MTEFQYFSLAEAPLAQGTVVVIDVLRAFTTAAYAFAGGASWIYPVATVDEALQLKYQRKDVLLMGEVAGYRPAGFDFGNSPVEVQGVNLSGKTLVHRSSAGTQGLVRAAAGVDLLAASFVVARATAVYLARRQPDLISFVVTGETLGRDGDEDRACGEYIEALVRGADPNPEHFLRRIKGSTVWQLYERGEYLYLSEADYAASAQVNRFDFCLPVQAEGKWLVMKKQLV